MERAMNENCSCPICGEKVLFIGVHDDEGNYKGRIGCEYESDPWSGLSYGLHHEGWGICPLCTDGNEVVMGGCLYGSAKDAFEALCTLSMLITLINVNDEKPPDNERVLVYRPCMEESDIGPYSVQWGWAAKRDSLYWAHLYNKCPLD